MNSQIIEEYNHRPKNWFYYLLIFIVLLAVSIWSTSVVHIIMAFQNMEL